MDLRDRKPSRENRDAVRSDMVVDALRQTGRLRLRVHGESMLPALWPGDDVELVACVLENVQLGEIVLAHREGRLFLHRLITREGCGRFILRGDSMAAMDPTYEPTAFVGKLVGVSRGGRIAFRSRTWTKRLGWLLCHCGAVRRLALRLRRGRILSASLPVTYAREAHDRSS